MTFVMHSGKCSRCCLTLLALADIMDEYAQAFVGMAYGNAFAAAVRAPCESTTSRLVNASCTPSPLSVNAVLFVPCTAVLLLYTPTFASNPHTGYMGVHLRMPALELLACLALLYLLLRLFVLVARTALL